MRPRIRTNRSSKILAQHDALTSQEQVAAVRKFNRFLMAKERHYSLGNNFTGQAGNLEL